MSPGNKLYMAKSHFYIKIFGVLIFFIYFLFPETSEAQTGDEVFRHVTPGDDLLRGFKLDIMNDMHGYICIEFVSKLNNDRFRR